MALQLNFAYNYPRECLSNFGINNGSLSVYGFNIYENISLLSMNIAVSASSTNTNVSHTFSIGWYSMNGNTLSILNSLSAQFTASTLFRGWVSLTATSAAQNLGPGTWYIGLLVSTSVNSKLSFFGGVQLKMTSGTPSQLIGGVLSVSTAGLPASIATSDLTLIGAGSLAEPVILLTA